MRSFASQLTIDPISAPVLLSPHCDDAVLDCWALLESPAPLTVVNVFTGLPARGRLTRWDKVTGAADSLERIRERIAEDRNALSMAGRTAINLALLDAEYREPHPQYSLRQVDDALSAAVGTASRVLAPAALGPNEDHRLLRRYARALNLHGMPVSLYADLPYCVTHGWPPWVNDTAPDPHRDVDAFWRSMLWDLPELGDIRSGHVRRLDKDSASRKLAAMRAYITQFSALNGGSLGLLSNPAIHSFEVVWHLDAESSRRA